MTNLLLCRVMSLLRIMVLPTKGEYYKDYLARLPFLSSDLL